MAEPIGNYARKTYRYLRIGIVGVVVALILATVFESMGATPWLGSISAYYYSPVGPLFAGALIMIGVCLVAIRGVNDAEDVVLNLTGMLAPVVALVPVDCPSRVDCRALEPVLPRVDLFNTNIAAAAVASVVAVVVSFGLATWSHRADEGRHVDVAPTTRIGLAVAVLLVVGLVVVELVFEPQVTHGLAAALLIAGLWVVAMGNALRHVPADDGSGRPRWVVAFWTGAAGTAVVLGTSLAAVGAWRVAVGAELGVVVTAVGVALVGGAAVWLRPAIGRWFAVLGGDRFCRIYLILASIMLVVGPVIALVPIEWSRRVYWLEVAELVPFGVFWLVQTVEYWYQDLPDATTIATGSATARGSAGDAPGDRPPARRPVS